MNEIEFLPKKYLEKRARSNVKWSRLLLLMLVLVGIVGVGLYQVAALHHLHSQLAEVDDEHQRIVKLMTEVNNKREVLNRLQHSARLLTFLEHPYPRSQILAALVNPLSDQIALSQIHLTHQQTDPNVFRTLADLSDPKQAATVHPMKQDLNTLTAESRLRQCTVELAGTTDDPSTLYNFLTALHQSEIVETAKIESIDPHHRADGTEFSNFTAHIKIKRGYGTSFDEVVGQTAGSQTAQDRLR